MIYDQSYNQWHYIPPYLGHTFDVRISTVLSNMLTVYQPEDHHRVRGFFIKIHSHSIQVIHKIPGRFDKVMQSLIEQGSTLPYLEKAYVQSLSSPEGEVKYDPIWASSYLYYDIPHMPIIYQKLLKTLKGDSQDFYIRNRFKFLFVNNIPNSYFPHNLNLTQFRISPPVFIKVSYHTSILTLKSFKEIPKQDVYTYQPI